MEGESTLQDQNLILRVPHSSNGKVWVCGDVQSPSVSSLTFEVHNEKTLLVKEASSKAVQWQGPLGAGSQGEHHSSSSDAYEGVGRGL